jgi:hypothetical protein
MEFAMIEVENSLDAAVLHAKGALESHPVFARITNLPALRCFMQVHVYAVWDFMSLAKRLQRDYTCLELPWMPPADITAARLLNEIILGEETDVDPAGEPASHLELYLGAMSEGGASTVQFEDFLGCLRAGASPESALRRAGVPRCAVDFVRHTLQVALYGSTITVLANFFHGRENIIPGMFRGLLREWGIARAAAPRRLRLRVARRRDRPRVVLLARRLRRLGGGEELAGQRPVDQDAGDARVVVPGAAADLLRAARDRVRVSHATTRAGRRRSARRRRERGMRNES